MEELQVVKVRSGWVLVKAVAMSLAVGVTLGGLTAMGALIALKPEVEEAVLNYCTRVVASDVGQRVEARREGFARPTGEHEGGGLMDVE